MTRGLEELRDEALSPEVRAEWAASAAITLAHDRAHPVSLEEMLRFIDPLREAFREPRVDRAP